MDTRTAALQLRTLEFGIRVVRLAQAYPGTPAGTIVAGQLISAATSVGAGYRAVCCTRSLPESADRMEQVIADAERCVFWLALSRQAGMITGPAAAELYDEAQELSAVLSDSLLSITHQS